ncbi:MAG: hypothetical protein WD794_17645 [Mycobacteriales bacterium]
MPYEADVAGAGVAVVALAGAAVALPGGPEDRVTAVYPAAPAEEREPAVWEIDAADPPQAAAAGFSVLVTRLGCSSGETGEVLRPEIGERQETR